jgi:hypothetical protein
MAVLSSRKTVFALSLTSVKRVLIVLMIPADIRLQMTESPQPKEIFLMRILWGHFKENFFPASSKF